MGTANAKQQNLQIKIVSGETQSQELFDFHSSQHEQIVNELKFPSLLAFSQGDVLYINDKEEPECQQEGCEPLYRIMSNQHHKISIHELFERDSRNDQNYIWKVLGEGEQIPLEEGDWIKIGKIKMKFKEVVGGNSGNRSTLVNSDRDETERMDASSPIVQSAKIHSDGQCRVCFDNADSIENPMLSLCKCSGSVKYIHYECLKDWISNNIRKDKSSNCLFYSYFQPKCDLCRQPIANQFKHQGLKYTLYQFEKIQTPYAVFQNRSFDQDANKIRISMYMITLPEKNQVSVGRNHTSQVILRDISVSRNHCSLMYKFGKLFLQDRKSKFGTLVCPQKGFQFSSRVGLQLQFQSRVIKIGDEKTPLNSCCCAETNSYFVEINKGLGVLSRS